MIITIDGPAGAGKTSVSKTIASQRKVPVLDTGAMYRVCALVVLRAGADPYDADAVRALVPSMDVGITVMKNGVTAVTLDGENVSGRIRSPEVDKAVTPVCQVPEVREAMVAAQRRFAEGSDLICEGRDMGSVVFPEADVKIWLDADPHERAIRRSLQSGHYTIEQAYEDIIRRDEADASRELSPMTVPAGAHVVDTTGMSFFGVVEAINSIITNAMREEGQDA